MERSSQDLSVNYLLFKKFQIFCKMCRKSRNLENSPFEKTTENYASILMFKNTHTHTHTHTELIIYTCILHACVCVVGLGVGVYVKVVYHENHRHPFLKPIFFA